MLWPTWMLASDQVSQHRSVGASNDEAALWVDRVSPHHVIQHFAYKSDVIMVVHVAKVLNNFPMVVDIPAIALVRRDDPFNAARDTQITWVPTAAHWVHGDGISKGMWVDL